MSKEYLEALDGLFDLVTCQGSFEKAQKFYYIIEEALQRLEAIEKGKNRDIIDNYMSFVDARKTDPKSLERFITDVCNKPSIIMTEPKDKYYRVFIRQYSIIYDDYLCYVKLIKTNDIYHWIGYYYSTALENVKRIDYQEIDEETYKKEKPRTYYKGELL